MLGSARAVRGPQSLFGDRAPSLGWRMAGERGGERARMKFITGSTTCRIPN